MAEPNLLARALRQGAGALETGATFGSGLLGSVPAGYMGLVELLRSGDTSRAADKVAQTQSALTYQPRTNAGQRQTNTLADLLSYTGKPAEWIGEQTMNATGSPMAATAANMVLDPLNYIGPGLLGKGMKGAANAAPRLFENAMIPSQYNKQMGAIVLGDFKNKLESLNPTGTIFTNYNPADRATLPLGKNLGTLDKTMGVNPNDLVTIYRGVPSGISKINAGDFITTNEHLAKDYAGNGRVISQKVPAKSVIDDLTDPLGEEYIYRP